MGSCVFCGIVDGSAPAEIVLRDGPVVAFLDARPLFKGHVLVVPSGHVETLDVLEPALVAPLFAVVHRLVAVLPTALGAQGSFVAVNNRVSQSVPHLHVHVVPRTKGDGLRGFFWPRQSYDDTAEMAGVADTIREALARG